MIVEVHVFAGENVVVHVQVIVEEHVEVYGQVVESNAGINDEVPRHFYAGGNGGSCPRFTGILATLTMSSLIIIVGLGHSSKY